MHTCSTTATNAKLSAGRVSFFPQPYLLRAANKRTYLVRPLLDLKYGDSSGRASRSGRKGRKSDIPKRVVTIGDSTGVRVVIGVLVLRRTE